jgi:uncharacterized protein YacL
MKDFIEIILLAAILGMLYQQHKNAKPKAASKSTKKLVLDTCALIDGRILELSKSGFVPEELIIPEFVIHELQLLADGSDPHKRERARFGLDVVRELQDSRHTEVIIDRNMFPEKAQVDDKLVALAKQIGGQLYTTDYNLNKVADIEGVRVLNVNELAQNVRPIAIPGEHKMVKIMQRGSNANQGVGYLDDGTMIVVDNAARLIGKIVDVEVTRIHQTVAGKMLFGVTKLQQPETKKQPSAPRLNSTSPQQKATSLRRRLRTRTN